MSVLHPKNPLSSLIFGGVMAWGAWALWQKIHHSPFHDYSDWLFISYMLGGLAALLFLKAVLITLFFIIPQAFRYLKAFRLTTKGGSAGWASTADLLKTYTSRKGYLAGLIKKRKPLFFEFESSLLVLAAAGVGKTVRFVIPALCHNPSSMIVPDLKGALSVMTGKLRQKLFKHTVLYINPAGLYEGILGKTACYNPLQILIDDWADPKKHSFLFPDATAIALQLSPEPANAGENFYWRSGGRKFLVFAFIYLVTRDTETNLSKALSLLSVMPTLRAALDTAAASEVLSGDLARLAQDIIAKLDSGDPKQVESFREGAVQALDVYTPSGSLAQCTSRCDFRFHDMRKSRRGLLRRKGGTTVYLVADSARMEVYKPWLGLMMWCALTELMRAPKGQPVCFMGDEITNFKVSGLPGYLTLVREYKIRLILIVQELQEWANTYGKDSVETLLSQTEAKIIMGIRSQQTMQLISDMLGDETVKSLQYNLGASFFDPVSRTLSETSRRLKTPDEIRRNEKTILILRGERPILLDPIGYHEVSPWKHHVAINPLHGKRYKSKTRLKI